MSENVSIVVGLVDNASRGISGIFNALRGAGSAIGSVAGILTAGAGITSLASSVIGIGSVLNAQESLNGQIGAIGSAAYFMGTDMATAAPFIKNLQMEMLDLAGALPGTTQDYIGLSNALVDNVIPAFTDLNGEFDQTRGTEIMKNIAGNMGVLQAQAGKTTAQTQGFLAQLLSGNATEAGLMALDFGRDNIALMDSLSKQAKDRNMSLDELLKGDKKTLLEAVEAAGSAVVTPELRDSLSNTTGGIIEGVKTNLFDPLGGLFGALREVEIDGKMRTLESAFAPMLSSVVGTFGTLSDAFTRITGLEFDPMKMSIRIADGIKNFSDVLGKVFDGADSFGEVFSNIKAVAMPKLQGIDLGSIFNNLGQKIQPLLTRFLGGIGDLLKGVDVGQIGFNIGSFVGKLIAGSGDIAGKIASGLGQLIGSINWFSVALAIGQGITGLITGFVSQVPNILSGMASLLTGSLGLIAAALTQLVSSSLGLLVGLVSPIVSGIGTIFVGIGTAILGVFTSIGSMLGPVLSGLGSMMLSGLTFIVTAIQQIPMQLQAAAAGITAFASSIGGVIASGIGAALSSMRGGITGMISSISSGITDLWSQVKAAASAGIAAAAAAAVAAARGGAASIGGAISSAISGLFSRIRSAAASAISSISIPGFGGGGGGVSARASGSNLGAFRNAMARESSRGGTGKPVIANSNEAIIPMGLMSRAMDQMRTSVGGSSGRGGVTIGSIVINSNATNGTELYQEFLAKLESEQSMSFGSTLV